MNLFPLLIFLAPLVHPDVPAMDPGLEPIPSAHPEGEAVNPFTPLGQPPIWALRGTASLSTPLAPGSGAGGGGEVGVSLSRPLLHPVAGLLRVRAEGGMASRLGSPRPEGRLLLESPAFLVHGGVAWNGHAGLHPRVGMTLPVRRGGWPLPGGMLEVGWSREAGHRFRAGFTVPLTPTLEGRARERVTFAPLPPGRRAPASLLLPPELAGVEEELLRSMGWIATLHNLYWFTERSGIRAEEKVLRSRQILELLELERLRRDGETGGGGGYPGEVAHYHQLLARGFHAAAGGEARWDPVGPLARQVMRDRVVLPYNATVGRLRHPDRLNGLVEEGVLALDSLLAREFSGGLPAEDHRRVLDFFRAWGAGIEAVRQDLARWTRDTRVQWIPLALVLHPSEHATHAQVDALVAHALGRPWTEGNRVDYFDGPRFRTEVVRTIRETERYHVLWIHDFRGVNDNGVMDRVGFEVVEAYLEALIQGVERHDRGQPFPVFTVLIDQFFYEETKGRRWLTFLEDPLERTLRLPPAPPEFQERIHELQTRLRQAVAASAQLEEEARAHGPRRIRDRVRVHVNVTHPSDFSFRTPDLLRFPLGADNLMRDHRKLVLRDLDPAHPMAGELILTGKGVGELYVEVDWEDRSLRVQGAGAHHVLDELRVVLEMHGMRGDRLPDFVRLRPGAPAGSSAPAAGVGRLLQVHNRTGWGPKEASFLQMLLYDLLPPGTVLYVPDSLWTSPEWMAQLASAALRGCHVVVVAPALSHAPQPAFPSMSESRHLLTGLLLVREVMGDRIEAAGGSLEVGLYLRQGGSDDVAGRVRELRAALRQGAIPPSLVPLVQMAAVAEEGGGRHEEVSAPPRPPRLHSKTQLFASMELLGAVGSDPRLGEILTALEAGRISDRDAQERVRLLLPPDPAPPLHLFVGSLNKNVRSMALDGEAMVLLSGEAAGVALLDFLLLAGEVRWLGEVETLDPLLPPPLPWQRILGRFFLRIV